MQLFQASKGRLDQKRKTLASTIILLQQMEILPGQYDPTDRTPPITKPPLLQRSRLTGGGSPNLVGLVERKSLQRDLWELQIVPIDFIHDCTLVLYKQLIQTGFGCYPSDFTLCRDFLSTRTQILGEPLHTSSIALQQRLGLAPMLCGMTGQKNSCFKLISRTQEYLGYVLQQLI